MTARATLVLVRHGPSAQVHTGGLLTRAEFEGLRNARDLVGIEASTHPPAPLHAVADDAGIIVASDLPRAIESAERLAGGRAVTISALVREYSLPIPAYPWLLPDRLWELLVHSRWFVRIMRGTDAPASERQRANEAADLLSALAREHGTVLVVTHGVFRRIVSRELLSRSWTDAGREGGYEPWSAWSFSAPRASANHQQETT